MSSLGSEYLFASLGLNVVGIFSMTTAQLLLEVPFGPEPRKVLDTTISQLAVYTLTRQYGASPQVRGSGKTHVAVCFCPPLSQVLTFQVSLWP